MVEMIDLATLTIFCYLLYLIYFDISVCWMWDLYLYTISWLIVFWVRFVVFVLGHVIFLEPVLNAVLMI